MKATLKPGLQQTRRVIVEDARVTRHMGADLGVYATPAMLNDMEYLCRDLLQGHLDAGEDSVGTRADIQHLAATPEGLWVDLHATILAIDKRAVTFEVVARDAVDDIGRCTHHRFVVDTAKTKERLRAKLAKANRR
jgi:fluoroacetyl-CoA thioesterase